ncbi:dienelactone hydrolase family protein [Ideonella sp. YS5]|uniref:dienelactone hydrolase family protein n=1 Tax=Ideonella sp. YS5 TaxID=3453714 RepID=UPI003EF08761
MEELLTQPKRVLVGLEALEGDLTLPPQARGLVVFAHGSGSTRRSPRNREVAHALQELSLGTLLFDLLTPDEATERSLVFDIELLGRRLLETIEWLDRRPALASLPLGLFGASTGAAAAFVAAAERPDRVAAIVSRGGRPDLAAGALPKVKAPTLLIVGGADTEVLELNRAALKLLHGPASLRLVPRATHLFEEAGALQRVTDLAAQWFTDHLAPVAAKGVRRA